MNNFSWWIAIFAVIIVASALSKQRRPTPLHWPFFAKNVMSDPEQVLYWRLVKALPDYAIFPQVGLSRFLGVKRGNRVQEWNNRINRMSVDFLICRADASVVLAVELDEASHSKADRKAADQKKDAVLKAAGIPLMRWTVGRIPIDEQIRAAVEASTLKAMPVMPELEKAV